MTVEYWIDRAEIVPCEEKSKCVKVGRLEGRTFQTDRMNNDIQCLYFWESVQFL